MESAKRSSETAGLSPGSKARRSSPWVPNVHVPHAKCRYAAEAASQPMFYVGGDHDEKKDDRSPRLGSHDAKRMKVSRGKDVDVDECYEPCATPTSRKTCKQTMLKGKRCCIVGCGNWGSTLSRIVGQNADRLGMELVMWVFEEVVDGEKLSHIINSRHENVKYLPGRPLPDAVVAEPDLVKAVSGADYLIFVIPHQFLPATLKKLKGKVKRGAIAITAIKGVQVTREAVETMSELISRELHIECGALSGANIAAEVALEVPTESTVACPNEEHQGIWKAILSRPYFAVSTIKEVQITQIYGALKNIVAVAAGLCDGLELGDNTKGAVLRRGMVEMIRFAQAFYGSTGDTNKTFMESCGIADLITTCYGGRNRKCAEAFARAKGEKSMMQIEKELLNGQKLQGFTTAAEIYDLLTAKDLIDDYPLFTIVHKIATKVKPCSAIASVIHWQ